jgi:1-aminocyclopropane-1-carboxylate deaminase/D-cysteine desulfhydrase-like pyridoxal-dependent ACC family enzyme
MHELFNHYPDLAEKLPLFPIGSYPTPVQKLEGLCRLLNRDHLYIKRDDLSAVPYGGNKVRKLEFLIGDALSKGATRIITSGAAGSNHALATAIYAKKAGLKATLMLFAQPNALPIRQNLLMDLYSGAELFHDETYEAHRKHLTEIADYYLSKEKAAPYIIPAGGTSPLSMIGFVNAAFELRQQIDQGDLPMISRIYTIFGTMGTAAGLLLGMKSAGIKCKLIMVRVVPSSVADMRKFTTLYNEGNRFIHDLEHSFPILPFSPDDTQLTEQYLGAGYGIFTEKSRHAVREAEAADGIHLDGTYTGKAFAAMIDDARKTDEAFLFWHTKNSHPFPPETLALDYHMLPEPFHRYFEEPVQEEG